MIGRAVVRDHELESAASTGAKVELAARFNHAAAAFMIVALTAACSTLAWATGRADLRIFSVYQKRYQVLLWSSSALLALAILQVALLYQWGAALYEDGTARSAANAITVAFGVIASGLACVVFLPTAILQSARLDKLVDEQCLQNGKTRKAILEDHGLEDLNAVQLFARQLPLVAPLITGLVSQALMS